MSLRGGCVRRQMSPQRDYGRMAETLLIVLILATVNATLFSVIYRMVR